jgi:hypothetical protein
MGTVGMKWDRNREKETQMICSILQQTKSLGFRIDSSAAGVSGGWPPADCCLQNEKDLLPRGWWQASAVQAAEHALSEAHLPSYRPISGSPGELSRGFKFG